MSFPALFVALGRVVPVSVPRMGPMPSISADAPAQRAMAAAAATPDAPGQVTASSTTPTSASVSWQQVQGNTGYRVERAAGNGAFSILTTTSADQNSFSDSGLTTGVSYRYRVSTVSGNQFSGLSPVGSVTPVVATNLTAPTALTATNPTPSTVLLTWSGTTVSQAVLVQRSLDGGLNWNTLATISGASTTYTDNVNRNTLYAYRLQASTFSATSPFTGSVALLTPPAEVASFLRTAISANTAELTWTVSLGGTGYAIEQSKEGGPYAVVQQLAGGTTRTTITDLDTGTSYQFRVRATNAGGSSLTTQVNGVLTISAAPAGLTAQPSPGPSIELSFLASKGASSYVVERKQDGFPFTRLTTLNANTLSYVDRQVVIGEGYEYRVKAISASGDSEYSSPAAAAVTLSGTLPVPDDLTLSIGPKSATVLNWAVVADPGSFLIQRQVGTLWRNVGAAMADQRSFALKGLAPGQSVRFRVVSASGGTLGTPSADVLATPAPGPTRGLRTLGAPTSTRVTLTWAAPKGAANYTLERSLDRGQTFSTVASGFGVAGYADETVQPGQTYSYRVFATNDTGAGGVSPLLTVTTAPATPSGISAVAAIAPAKGAVVSWIDVAGETGYRVMGSVDGVKWSNAAATRANVSTATVRNAKFQFFRVASMNRSGVSPFSGQVTFPVVTAGMSVSPVFSNQALTLPQESSKTATEAMF